MNPARPAAARRRRVRHAAGVVGALGVAGALAGVVWELIWTPPAGVVVEDEFVLTSLGLTQSFDGTALYALVAVATGLLVGAAAALLADGAELDTLVAVALGSLLAAAVMAVVGAALGPPDAGAAARDLEDYTLLPQDLRIEGVGAYLAFPSGALLGAGSVFLSRSRRQQGGRRLPSDQTGGHRSGEDPGDSGGAGGGPR